MILEAKYGHFTRYSKDESLSRGDIDEDDDRTPLTMFPADIPMSVLRWPGAIEFMPDIDGITRPMLYLPEIYSPFPCHEEDAQLCSASYLSVGSSYRLWFFVPARDRQKVVRHLVESGVARSEHIAVSLFASRTMWLDPSHLARAGIDVFYVLQRPGSFM